MDDKRDMITNPRNCDYYFDKPEWIVWDLLCPSCKSPAVTELLTKRCTEPSKKEKTIFVTIFECKSCSFEFGTKSDGAFFFATSATHCFFADAASTQILFSLDFSIGTA